MNGKLYIGDNLEVMRILKDNSVDLIYADPPFNSNRNYAAPAGTVAEGSAFTDLWSWSDISKELYYGLMSSHEDLVPFLTSLDKIAGESMKTYCVMMAARILEMDRILKKTGTIYIHCDHTAVSYLKIIMDSVFGLKNFRNQIAWQRHTGNKPTSRNLPNNSDYILRYTKGNKFVWNVKAAHLSPDEKYSKKYNKDDDDGKGRYYLNSFILKGQSPGPYYEILGLENNYRWSEKKAKKGVEDGIVVRVNNTIYNKIYLSDAKGQQIDNIWSDIPAVSSRSSEYTGYPTQKPKKLLNRIISLSTKPGQTVLDPFCGSGTTCIAAHDLGRKYIGIDISETSIKFLQDRLVEELGFLNHNELEVIEPNKKSADQKRRYIDYKPDLFLKQKGYCNGCQIFLLPQHLTVDHIDGNRDNNLETNLQLLCNNCNSIKGQNDMEYLRVRIQELRIDEDKLYI